MLTIMRLELLAAQRLFDLQIQWMLSGYQDKEGSGYYQELGKSLFFAFFFTSHAGCFR